MAVFIDEHKLACNGGVVMIVQFIYWVFVSVVAGLIIEWIINKMGWNS